MLYTSTAIIAAVNIDNFAMEKSDIFSCFVHKMDYEYPLEQPQGGGSSEYLQSMI